MLVRLEKKIIDFVTGYQETLINDVSSGQIDISRKIDNSIITQVDLLLSKKIKQLIRETGFDHVIIDEEDVLSHRLSFPCFIIDPIDGTRELGSGRPECAVSIAYMNSSVIADTENWGLIINPFNLIANSTSKLLRLPKHKDYEYRSLVSRTEYEEGLHLVNTTKNELIIPMGSIAYKLMLLSLGICDRVKTSRKKNLWDIAAGSVILAKQGIMPKLNGEIVEKFNSTTIGPGLSWERI